MTPDNDGTKRGTLIFRIFLIACILLSFWSGYKWGRQIEKQYGLKPLSQPCSEPLNNS